MANQILFAKGRERLSQAATGYLPAPTFNAHLFTNSPTLDSTSTILADFLEASFGGYAPIPVGGWTAPIVAAPRAFCRANPWAWIATGAGLPVTVNGEYVTDSTNTDLIIAQYFPTPQTLAVVNDYILYQPKLFWRSLYTTSGPGGGVNGIRLMDSGKKRFLEYGTSLRSGPAYTVHLFKNDPAMTDVMVLANFTQSTFGGYAPQAIPSWFAGTAGPNEFVQFSTANLFFFCTSGASVETAYGYYVVDSDGVLCWAEHFQFPYDMSYIGALAIVLPQISVLSEFIT